MTTGSPHLLRELAGLQTELVELAFRLEQQGRVDAADLAVMTAARIGELCADPVPADRQAEISGTISLS